MQAIIMAGGKGTRLLSITQDEIPKPMVPIAGKPILQWQIEQLKSHGVDRIILIIGHLGNVIHDYFRDGTDFGVSIEYITEKTPLGTAGALSLLEPFLKDEDFFLVFGDVIFSIDLDRMMAFHRKKQAIATLFVHPNSHPFDSDLVICDDNQQVIAFDPKNSTRDYWYHNCVNAGFYILNKSICKFVSQNTKVDLEKQLLSDVIKTIGQVYAYNSPEYIKDVGTVDRINDALKDLSNGIVFDKCLLKPQRAIFFDRDGTINKKNGLVYKEEQFELEEYSTDAIKAANHSGYLAILVSNQPVVARGLCDISDVERIHMKMETQLGLDGAYFDAIRFCPHHPDKGYPEENPVYKIKCHCRKPGIGMIEECVENYNIDLSKSWIIGDTTIDIKTGKNAGIKTALVLTGDAGTDNKYDVKPDIVCKNVFDAVNQILEG